MTTIVSKRHFLKFYLSTFLAALVFITLGTALLLVYNKASATGHLKTKQTFIPFLSFAFYAFTGYSTYRYFKNSPNITLNNEFITFNNETFSLSDIAKVELTGKKSFNYAIGFPMEAATLFFKNGVTKYIFDDMYSNSWEIKSFLKQVLVDKKNYSTASSSPIDKNVFETGFYERYDGNQLISFRGILLWGLPAWFAYIIVNGKRPLTIGVGLVWLGTSLFWFFIFSYQMHYFEVFDNYLLIRNHNLFWRKKDYNISDITEIVFETQGRMPNCLRVITKDFKSRLYLAGTLRDKTWLSLKDKLESYGIKVRNECIR